MRYMIYPVYYREGYGCQTDNPEGTDGKPVYWTMVDEQTCEAVYETSNDLVLQAIQAIAEYLNEEEE